MLILEAAGDIFETVHFYTPIGVCTEQGFHDLDAADQHDLPSLDW